MAFSPNPVDALPLCPQHEIQSGARKHKGDRWGRRTVVEQRQNDARGVEPRRGIRRSDVRSDFGEAMGLPNGHARQRCEKVGRRESGRGMIDAMGRVEEGACGNSW